MAALAVTLVLVFREVRGSACIAANIVGRYTAPFRVFTGVGFYKTETPRTYTRHRDGTSGTDEFLHPSGRTPEGIPERVFYLGFVTSLKKATPKLNVIGT